MIDFKNIHIGQIIEKRVHETNIDMNRICTFLKSTPEEVEQMYTSESIDSYTLLRWSKLLEYDFFRVYSQHILLFSSVHKEKRSEKNKGKNSSSPLPQFRKNIYTKEIIEFILESVNSGEKTKQDIINIYHIPKTTLYKWFSKYNANPQRAKD
ncbi:transposase [Chryseobacterium formosense]|uniref:Transposase n=1 Tax=Chryseobacterium formosense TaxID=236814 RepID=A0A085Z797_9FLAO|nr:hypothetical protein [Chryseobacterium formosense]KFF00311.1 transposase [Chryseobacterium formosense]SFT64384.1 hypothetical protein SAMN05421857_2393 [Chryseobacterium formosense]